MKYTIEQRQEALEMLKTHKIREVSRQLGISPQTLTVWKYRQERGDVKVVRTPHREITAEEKYDIVMEYLKGDMSMSQLARKYGVSSASLIGRWVQDVHNGKQLRTTMNQRPKIKGKRSRSIRNDADYQKLINDYYEKHRSYTATSIHFNEPYHAIYRFLRKYRGGDA